MSRAAVLGRPIEHSLSPVLHRAAYSELGLDWTYDAIDCGADELPDVLHDRCDWAGFSCTMPLKHTALEVAATVSELAQAIGAANTLVPGPGGWHADNTDADGVRVALAEHGIVPDDVTVLGAGGTAQAVLGALAATGVDSCDVLVRDRSRATALEACAERVGVQVRLGDLEPDAALLAAPLVVSTLPPGAADAFAARRWTHAQAVLDVVYVPWPTPLAAAAQTRGATVVSGALMLLHQAAAQVRLMTGAEPPVAAMRSALEAALAARA